METRPLNHFISEFRRLKSIQMSRSPFTRRRGGRISGDTTSYSLYVRVLKADIISIIVGFWLVFVYAASPKNKLKSIQMSW